MSVLAIETATAVCAAAVVDDATALAEQTLVEKHIHSEKLLSVIDAVLQRAGNYDAVAISIGPGSFTGLRIGLSVAKGLAYATGKPLVAVPTLEALVWRSVHENVSREGQELIGMIDARRNDVYAAAYRVERGQLRTVWGAEPLSLDALVERISDKNPTLVMGDAVEKFEVRYKEFLSRNRHVVVPPARRRLCSAASVGIIGMRKVRKGEFADLPSLEPLYGKEFLTLVRTQHVSS